MVLYFIISSASVKEQNEIVIIVSMHIRDLPKV